MRFVLYTIYYEIKEIYIVLYSKNVICNKYKKQIYYI